MKRRGCRYTHLSSYRYIGVAITYNNIIQMVYTYFFQTFSRSIEGPGKRGGRWVNGVNVGCGGLIGR